MIRYWINNGKIEKLIKDDNIPKGFTKGRLPVSSETKLKHSLNNGMHKLSKEALQKRNAKIKQTISSRTQLEKQNFSKNVSLGRKGKGLNNIPWNKGKRNAQKAWNKDKHYKLSDTSRDLMLQKRYLTQRQNNTLGINKETKAEQFYYNELLKLYNRDDIEIQYRSDVYPFKSDFYIKSIDKYIELNKTWTHGGMPYDPENPICQEKLKLWQEKAKTSKYYQNAIYTWTDLDVRKAEIAKKNNLNFEAVY